MDMDQIRAETEKRWPVKGSLEVPADWMDIGMACGFVLGAQWATQESQQ